MISKSLPIEPPHELPEVADAVELLSLLFDRLLLECERATACLSAGDAQGKSRALGRALEIVLALSQALDHTAAPELCSQMERLYFYAQERLEAADREGQASYVAEAVKVLSTLHQAFFEASKIAKVG